MQFRNTSLFSLRWRANPVNSYAIAYTVMVRLYFAFDTKELLRGDLQSRFAAYKTALDANFMQIDEVRYAEDMEADYFLIKELIPGFLDGISGTYRDPEGYFVCEKDPEGFAQFEATFPRKEKLRLPGQLFG